VRKILRLLAGAAVSAALALPSLAQHLGDVALSTTSINLATNLNCTSSPQNFITGTTPNFSNVGQIRHFLSIGAVTGIQKLRAEIDGIDNQGNVFRLSDQLETTGIGAGQSSTVAGSGNFPRIQVSVTCSPNTGTFSAAYAGDFGSLPITPGTYLSAQIDHVNFALAPANVGQADNGFQTPFGSSAGLLLFQFNGSSVAGATIGISCNSAGVAAAYTVLSTSAVANTTALQVFPIPAVACPLMNVQYGSPGGGTTVTAETIFAVPGLKNVNNGNAPLTGVDPCQSPDSLKQSQPINIVAAGTTSLVTLGTTQAIYVCGGSITVASSATTPGTVQFIAGTGATCGTGTVVLTGTMGTGTATAGIDAEPVVLPGGMTNFIAPLGNRLCVVAAGTTVNIQGYITYVQQ